MKEYYFEFIICNCRFNMPTYSAATGSGNRIVMLDPALDRTEHTYANQRVILRLINKVELKIST